MGIMWLWPSKRFCSSVTQRSQNFLENIRTTLYVKIIFIRIIRRNNGKSVALALIEILQFCHTAATNPFLWDSPTLNWKSQASSTLPRNR